MLKYLAGVGVAALALWPSAALAAPAWEQWQSVGGVFDLGGPRSDGSLLVAGSAALYTLSPDGTLTPFARGSGGYKDDPGAEAYLAVSPGLSGGSGCTFAKDDTFILRLHTPVGVTRVDATGSQTGSFANVGVAGPNGIAFDTTGQFNHALLVTAPVSGKTEVAAIDCSGAVQVITKTAPVLEGGLAVAPSRFGAFGGDLIAPDELSGIIWAIAPNGSATQVANSGLPKGGDIGVESVAFVPSGFTKRGGSVYYSDRGTAGSPHAGTDHVLRLSSVDLAAAGVQDGDMLAATEGGASMIDVRCDTTCQVTPIVPTPTTAHGEGHLAFTLNPLPSPTPSPAVVPTPARGSAPVGAYLAIAAAIVAALAAVALAISAQRRRR
ncbi:MAG TPA: hypothetical protein VGX22_12215 [Candidatus Dormibacteraeota bacterium]|nr:hypothetical protein [Candidatus Dormibacteraeota bacterium]